MSRPLRIEFPEAFTLVSLQGADGVGLFVDPEDARHAQDLMQISADKHRVNLHAYALAQNSALLLVQTPDANLGKYLQGILTAYARYIRHHYVQQGPIMNGRYRARVVEPGASLRRVAEWIHGGPVRDRDDLKTPSEKRRFLERYVFSSYRATVGDEEAVLTDPTLILRAYGSPASKRGLRHQEAVLQSLTDALTEKQVLGPASSLAIGSEAFQQDVDKIQRRLRAGTRVKGVKTFGVKPRGVSRQRIVKAVSESFGVDRSEFFRHRHGSMLRPALAFLLYQFAEMTQKEIADFIDVGSAAAVSLQMKRLLQKRSEDPDLDRQLQVLERMFTSPRKSVL